MNEDEKHKEIWLPIVGYEGWYEISDLGRVKRVKAGRGTYIGRTLKIRADSHGYQQTFLYKNGEDNAILVHRIVMASFVGVCPTGKTVNHKDGDRTNNRLENLEYITPSENKIHAIRIGLCPTKLTKEDVHKIRGCLGKKPYKLIAACFNVSLPTIYDIAAGRTWAWLKEEE